MTEQQLAEAEVLAEVASRPFIEYHVGRESPPQIMSLVQAARYVPDLVAEVRRLRGLMLQAEWAASTDSEGFSKCPWCGSFEDWTHKPSCSAFGSEVNA